MSTTYAKVAPGLSWRALRVLAVGVVLFSLAFATAYAGTPAGYAEYIVPFDEDVFEFVTDPVVITNTGPTDPTFTLISVTAWSDTVTVYWDHWEDGYDYDSTQPDASADERYTLNAGQTLNFSSAAVPRPRTTDGNTYRGAAGDCVAQPVPQLAPAGVAATPDLRVTVNYCYDGRDRIVTVGGATTVTRGGIINTVGKVAAIGEEVFPLAPQLIKYVLPFGENVALNDYERVMAIVQATEDDTIIQIDFNGDGTYDSFNTELGVDTTGGPLTRADPVDATTLTLQRGQTYVLDRDSDGIGGLLNRGTVILGSKTLQVEYFYGEANSQYNTRAVSAYPNGFWATDYYLSADSSISNNTDALIYNPNTSPITITWETAFGGGTFVVAANTTAYFQALSGTYIPDGSGLFLHGTDVFWGTSDVDTNGANWDWGYSMVPDYLVSDDQVVAWAPGNDPLLACSAANGRGNGIYLTAALDNTTFFIDSDGDGNPDTDASIEVLRGSTPVAATGSGYRANRLESFYITGSNVRPLAVPASNSSCDLTGAHIYATGPFALSYGENRDKASAGGGLDLGYTVLPSPANWMDLALTVDKTTSPVLVSTVAGVTTVTYTLVVKSHEFNIEALSVNDILAPNWTYDSNSTTITFPDLTQISGAPANPTVSLPNLTWGTSLLGSMLPNQELIITFTARTTAPFLSGDITQNRVVATGTRTVDGVTQTFRTTDFAFNTFVDPAALGMQMTKTSSVPQPIPVSPGDPITYTVTVSNPPPATTTLTGVTVYDPMPPGVTYLNGTVSCEIPNPVCVLDQFNTNGSYAGNDGSTNWNGAWTETNDNNNAASGTILVTGNQVDFSGNGTANRSISRTANVTGATSATISFDITDPATNGIEGGETVVVEYSVDGGGFVNIGTLDGGTGYSGSNPVVVALSGNTTLQVRFRAPQTWSNVNDHVYIDNVQICGLQNIQNVRDSFNTNGSYAGNDGSANWNAAWTETLDNNNAATGTIRVVGNRVDFSGPGNINRSISRTANVTGVTSATISFSILDGGIEGGETVVVEYSVDGGGFVNIGTLDGGTGYSGSNPVVVPLSGNTTLQVRFRSPQVWSAGPGGDDVFIDDVDISWALPAGPGIPAVFPAGAPPELLASAAGCQIRPGQSMTVTFNVTVDDPFPVNQTTIVNTATSGVNEIPVPLMASATNIVLVPGGGTGTVGDRVWLDGNANGVFDAGETGISGVRVTLKDEFGTPLQTTITDSTGRYVFLDVPPGSGYYVEITGGLPSGLTQTTDTVRDAFNANGVFTGNNGTLTWLTNWTETNDDGSATTGDIRIANNRIEFRDTAGTVAANESIQRSAKVTGATSIQVQYDWAGPTAGSVPLVAGSDRVIVEYSTDGISWLPLRTINAGSAQTFTDTIAWTPTNNTLFLRYRTLDVLETNKLAAIDNVQVRFPRDKRTAGFNLIAGQQYAQADLGFRAAPGTATIGDLVWVDANNDQIRNPGEAGLAGITVQLFADTNGDGVPDGAPIATTVTGAGGVYLFTGVPADGVLDYVVTMNTGQPALTGYTATTNTLFYFANLPSGAVRNDADFGFRNPTGTFSIKDGIWLDNGAGGGIAGNGIKDGGEVGIGGVTVSLLDNASNTVSSVTTSAADGTFQFTGVPGGRNYSWKITDDAGVLNDYYGTTPSALSTVFQITGNLTGNLDYTSPSDVRHFGYNQTRTIGDTVFNDSGAGGGTLGNGVQDGTEPGISGVTVLLYRDVNNNGVFEPGGADGAAFATRVTDASGRYLFSGLPSGSRWFVSIDNTQSALSALTLTTADNSGVAGHQRFVTPILSGTANRLDIDYGYRATTPFTISGRLFSDANRNGIDDTETGFENVTVELVNDSGVVVATTTSAADGSYSFVGQAAGTYTVRVTDTNGILAGAETTLEKTEGGLAGSYNGQETIILGPTVTDVNFGYYRGNALVTRVVISSFAARNVRGAVALEWATSSEIGTVGFYLKRWDDSKERYVGVNKKLIPGLIGSTQGGSYRYLDRDASPDQSYRYLIVEVEASGRRLRYGPYDVDTRLAETTAPTGEDSDEDDDEVATAGRRFAADSLLLEKGESRTPRRAKARKLRDRRNTARAEHSRAAGRRRSSNAAKIGVSENGFYFVTLQDLQALAGMGATSRWSRTYALTNHDRPVAIAPSAEGDGFWFYGRSTESNVERDNVYRLSESSRGARMDSRRNPRGPDPSGNEVFVKTLHVEQDAIAVNNIFKDPDGDFYVWDFVFAGIPGFDSRSFTFRTDGAARSNGASVSIRLKGGTEAETNPDHHATFSLNGSQIGEAVFDGFADLVATLDFDGSLLLDGENTLTIGGLADTGADFSLFYVDSFDVSYSSRYRAHGNKVEVPAAGNQSVLISGFTRPDITLFDITSPTQPVFVQAPVVQTPDGTWGVVAASRNAEAVYYAVTPDGLVAPSRILPDAPSSLRRAGSGAEYVVITTEALKETAQSLADYRSDLSSMVVDIEDVYDEFNDGNPSPYALRRFLTYARNNWRTPPRYVVLAGEGTYDYKDVEGFGDNLIPTRMASTPDGLFPSDTWFVERTGARTEIAIGRLPLVTNAEFAEVIRKIKARETALALDESWLHSTLLVADDTDGGGNFVESSESVESLIPPSATLSHAYISTADGGHQARLDLLAAINEGTGLVNYFGHGGFNQVADESILTNADVPALLNLDRPSMMFALTCLVGNSSLPGYTTVGEQLLREEGGGLAALFAPTGMSENDLATPLGQGLHAALLDEDTLRIGDVVRAARKSYKKDGLPLFTLSIYNLLGDPAMRVR